MAAIPPECRLCCFCLFFLTIISAASALEFHVGGEKGWIKPAGDEIESYNQWAQRNRFHIGDSIYFKYKNDSVLVVDKDDYAHCSITNPVLKFSDGNTTFTFNRYGFFYFISGKPGHCKEGQKLIIRVMVHPASMGPVPAPATATGPSPSGDQGSGSDHLSPSINPMPNSAPKIKAEAFFVVVILGVFWIFLLFI